MPSGSQKQKKTFIKSKGACVIIFMTKTFVATLESERGGKLRRESCTLNCRHFQIAFPTVFPLNFPF